MSFLSLPRQGMRLLNPDGTMSAEWYRFMHDLNERAGGSSAPTNKQLSQMVGGIGAGMAMVDGGSGDEFPMPPMPGPAGPQGQPGAMIWVYEDPIEPDPPIPGARAEPEEMNYATRYDQDSSTPTFAYLGKAPVGSATSAAAWQIQKLDFGADGDVTVTWADGDAAFNNIWDDRASLTYS